MTSSMAPGNAQTSTWMLRLGQTLRAMASRPSGAIGLAIVLIHLLIALSSPWLVPFDYKAISSLLASTFLANWASKNSSRHSRMTLFLNVVVLSLVYIFMKPVRCDSFWQYSQIPQSPLPSVWRLMGLDRLLEVFLILHVCFGPLPKLCQEIRQGQVFCTCLESGSQIANIFAQPL
jgi:hypothetical protein